MASGQRRSPGFSLVEMVVAMTVALVLVGIGMPYFLKAYQMYQLTNAASQMADILRLTRYEAIRRNTPINCIVQAPDQNSTEAWVDSTPNGAPDPTEQIIVLGSGGKVIDAGNVPAGNLAVDAQVQALNSQPAGNATIQFDQRGAVSAPLPIAVNVFYLAGADADAGYRAVLLMPAGSIQIWMGDSNGNWQQIR